MLEAVGLAILEVLQLIPNNTLACAAWRIEKRRTAA
jgi:hypothetical protein